MNISLIGNSALRLAIQQNLVSFPSQVPNFTKRPGGDTQERIAKLYFSLGWTVRGICQRYGLSRTMVQKLLADWRMRAVGAGFIQAILPEELAALVNVEDEGESVFSRPDASCLHLSPWRPIDRHEPPVRTI